MVHRIPCNFYQQRLSCELIATMKGCCYLVAKESCRDLHLQLGNVPCCRVFLVPCLKWKALPQTYACVCILLAIGRSERRQLWVTVHEDDGGFRRERRQRHVQAVQITMTQTYPSYLCLCSYALGPGAARRMHIGLPLLKKEHMSISCLSGTAVM